MRRPKVHRTARVKLKLTVAIMAAAAGLFSTTITGNSVKALSSIANTDERQGRPMMLDIRGKRGSVLFSHQKHESLITPDPSYPHEAAPGLACVGCHHSVKQVTNAEQFQKCSACHKAEGDPDNPEDKEGYDLNAREIFHRSCIGCHRASNVRVSNERFANASFTRCDESHDRQRGYQPVVAQSGDKLAVDEQSEIMATIDPQTAQEANTSDVDEPLGYAGRSRIDRPEPDLPGRVPTPDRW